MGTLCSGPSTTCRGFPTGQLPRARHGRISPQIEHRLFSAISMNWQGRPLTSHEVIVQTIAATTTRTGLTVQAELDTGLYPTGVKVGKSWTQPMYTGYTARGCTADFTTPVSACAQTEGLIGTLPWYEENGLVSDGDPGLAFGPAPGSNGFSWNNGDRLYYSNLAENFPAADGFKGFEAIAVSRMDNPPRAASSTRVHG